MRAWRRLVALASLCTAACAPDGQSPAEVVDGYFRTLGRDPARGLLLLTDAFHQRHGLTVRGLEGWLWTFEGMEPVERAGDPMREWSRRPPGLESAREAWLMAQAHPVFRQIPDALQVTVGETRAKAEGRSQVMARVQLPGSGAPFEQSFELVRTGGGWRIDRIEQRGVTLAQVPSAFVAYPNASSLRSLRLLRGLRGSSPVPAPGSAASRSREAASAPH